MIKKIKMMSVVSLAFLLLFSFTFIAAIAPAQAAKKKTHTHNYKTCVSGYSYDSRDINRHIKQTYKRCKNPGCGQPVKDFKSVKEGHKWKNNKKMRYKYCTSCGMRVNY